MPHKLANDIRLTAWKVSKYVVIFGPYFPVFGPNTGIYVPEITPYFDTFHAVTLWPNEKRESYIKISKFSADIRAKLNAKSLRNKNLATMHKK